MGGSVSGVCLSAGSTENLDIGRNIRVGNTSKEFIEGNMLRGVHRVRSGVKVKDILQSLGVTEKNAMADIRDRTVRATSTGRKGKDATAKSAEKLKVGFASGADFKRRFFALAMRSNIMQAKVMVESIRPEAGVKLCTTKKNSDGIADIAVTAFDRTILMGGIGSSRFDAVTSLGEESMHFGGTAQFTTKIHTNVFIGSIARTTVCGEPAIYECERRMLRGEGGTVEISTVVIGNQHIAGLAIESGEAMETFGVGRLLHDKGKINGYALVADSGTTRVTSTMSMPMKLGRGADRAKFHRISGRKLRYAFDKLMQSRGATEVQMGKTLMPKKT